MSSADGICGSSTIHDIVNEKDDSRRGGGGSGKVGRWLQQRVYIYASGPGSLQAMDSSVRQIQVSTNIEVLTITNIVDEGI